MTSFPIVTHSLLGSVPNSSMPSGVLVRVLMGVLRGVLLGVGSQLHSLLSV